MIFTLHTTYEALKKHFLCYIQRIKDLKDDFHATYDV